MTVRRIRRLGALGLTLLLLAVAVAPFLNADRYHNAIRLALEAALGRKVEIGRVRFTLYQGPTFSVQDVVIHDDPSFGLEPIAWVESLEASPHLLSLWSRKFRFTSLRLVNPVVNLARTTRWNFEPFLNRDLVATAPKLSVRGGRINFRLGDLRSVFYIANTDLDVTAPDSGGREWQIRFAGEPARTDRPSPGYDVQGFTSRGRWLRAPDGQDRLDLEIQLERSPIGEILALLYGRDIGVRGVASSTLRVSGPIRDLRIAGQARVSEIHRWDQTPLKGDPWPVALRGRLDMAAQSLELESQSDGKQALPLSLRYRVTNYLTDPRWAVSATWSGFPAEHLVPIARHMGAQLPAPFRLTGSVDGAMGYSGGGSLQGQLLLRDATISFGASALRASAAQVVFDGDEVRLSPSVVRAGEDTTATIEALYGWTTNRMEIGASAERALVRDLPFREAGLPQPLLDQLTSGTWSGKLRYQRADAGAKGAWSGQAQIQGASVAVDGLAAPLRALSASVQIQGERLVVDRLQARIGALEVSGSYRYEPAAVRPHRFRLVVPKAEGTEIERLLLPALRRRENFLARALGIGRSPEPDWLARRHADGTLHIGELTLGELSLSDFRTRLVWDASRVRWLDAQAKVLNGTAYGELEARLQRDGPVYHLNAVLESVDFKSGKLSADLRIDSSGTGAELLAKLRSEGSFTGRGLELPGPETLRSVSGCYRVEWAASQLRLRFTELQMSMGGDTYLGYGSSQDDGRLLLQLSSGAKQLRMIGTLAQLRVE